ncbi:MAG TPA: GNAT family N-acetyltransferase [Chloroflexota bacterium]
MELVEIEQPDDPLLVGVAELMAVTFVDPNVVLGLDRLQEFLAANERTTERTFHVLSAGDDERVIGLSVFSYVPASNRGFSEYIVVGQSARGSGLGRRLFDRRKAILDADARRTAQEHCSGLFIEAYNPLRTQPEHLSAELDTAIDPMERLRIFAHLGFRRVDVPYVQPPLAAGKVAVDYLDLLFAPWDGNERDLSGHAVLDTVRPIWASWAPNEYQEHLARLAGQVGEGSVALQPLFPTAHS